MSNYSQTTSQNRRQLMTKQANTPVKPRTGRIIKVMQSDFAATKERNEADYTDSAIWERHRGRLKELETLPEKQGVPLVYKSKAKPDKAKIRRVTKEEIRYILSEYKKGEKTCESLGLELGFSSVTIASVIKKFTPESEKQCKAEETA